jgi:hypothetical protein
MSRPQSRVIGGFLKSILHEEGIDCSQYPTLAIVRSSPEGQIDPVWSIGQLIQCYSITSAYLIEADNVEVEDETGHYGLDYLAIVLLRENDRWLVQVLTNIEDIYETTQELEKIDERFKRFGEKARKAILAFVE